LVLALIDKFTFTSFSVTLDGSFNNGITFIDSSVKRHILISSKTKEIAFNKNKPNRENEWQDKGNNIEKTDPSPILFRRRGSQNENDNRSNEERDKKTHCVIKV
jgi:hypothetical protein